MSNGTRTPFWRRPLTWASLAAAGLVATAASVVFFRSRRSEAGAPGSSTGSPGGPPPPPGGGSSDDHGAPPPPGGSTADPPGTVEVTFQATTGIPAVEVGGQVPDTPHCESVDDWDAGWVAKELELLEAVNALRAQGYVCATGSFAPVPPLTLNKELRCSARLHSKNMSDNNFFGHVDPQGLHSWDRMVNAGYEYDVALENVAAGYADVQNTMQQWKNSTTGHCEAMMNPDVTEIGIGYSQRSGTQSVYYWTQNFGKPKS